ncbi:MAG: hypothetical protein LBT40_09525 [Deltaproteobacteria bacterium]|nr:hypothetical protein [Deltaproteobacteria bacterium]
MEANRLLRDAAGRLAAALGESHRAAQDAQARLALFHTGDSGPVRLYVREPGEVPRQNFFAALEIWERIMAAPPKGPDGELRRMDAALRAVECLAGLGLLDRARRLREDFFGKRPRQLEYPYSPQPPETVAVRSREALAVYAEGQLCELGGDLVSSEDAYRDAVVWFRMSLGNSHRLAVRSALRLAAVLAKQGYRKMSSGIRTLAAEAMEDLFGMPVKDGALADGGSMLPPPPELPGLFLTRSLASTVFTYVGDRAEAVAAIAPQVEALARLLGRRDPRTVWAAKFLQKARRLP